MSGVEIYMTRVCVNTAVYWAAPVSDRFGEKSYDAGAEIKCLWNEKIVLFIDKEGKETASKAEIYVLEDLDNQGMLFLGVLTDLDAGEIADPKTVKNAFEIKQFKKIPSLVFNGEFGRKVFI